MDIKSILGYSQGSPYANHPYLDIFTPEGLIDMSNTPIPLRAVDETGYSKILKPFSGKHKFRGKKVRETPIKSQQGGLWQSDKKGYVDSTLNANKNLEWVQRLYDSNAPSIQIPGQKYPSTHFMESGDGKVYPTVVMKNGKLQYLGNKANEYANRTNTFIQFPNDQMAQWFGQNYKMGTGVLRKYQTGGRAPINVTDPKDPRLKAYQDSLGAYNNYNNLKQQILSLDPNASDYQKQVEQIEKKSPSMYTKGNNTNVGTLEFFAPKKWKNGEPIDPKAQIALSAMINSYKKPVQPVAYNSQQRLMRSITPMQNAPIYTDNPNDKRLRAYQDSLILSNPVLWDKVGTKGFHEAYDRLEKLNGERPRFTRNVNFDNGNSVYAKPVQPVVYRKPEYVPPPHRASYTKSIPFAQTQNGYSAPTAQERHINTETGVTPFQYQYRDDAGQQQVKYLPNYDIFKTFMEGQPLISGSGDWSPNSKGAGATGHYLKMQKGGYNSQDLYDFLFEDDEEEPLATAPSQSELGMDEEEQPQRPVADPIDYSMYNMAMDIALEDSPAFNSYYQNKKELQRTAKAGEYGKQIISDITAGLGYTPQFNSVFRTPEKQADLIRQGYGVKNSYHLTGDAVDMKPADWNKLPQANKQELKSKYDVIYHNNHYHLEPK